MEEKLLDAVARALEMDRNQVTMDLRAEDTDAWDSLSHLALVSEVETELGITIPIESIPEINSVQDFMKFVNA